MLSNEVFSDTIVSLTELFPSHAQAFLEPFKHVVDTELAEELHLKFDIAEKKHHKISPILRLARLEDAPAIISIYKELYNGTYPYKEMEDEEEVRKMIKDRNVQWVIYQDPSYNIAGCITFVLDFNQKRGYIRGFMLKKRYQRRIDITKAMIGSMLAMLYKYRDKIYVWYVENRTAHAKSQYSMWVCGIAPIGFYPNKDIFFGKVESDLMQILYDERALKKYRCEIPPHIIPSIEACFQYSHSRYDLGSYTKVSPNIKLNNLKLKRLLRNLQKDIKINEFGYETITLSFKNSESFFEFLYTPQVQNFEKTHYQVENLEELYIYTQEFLQTRKELKVRYCEVFVSAYHPEHQQIFYDAGLCPRGYVPSWEYCEKSNCFKDSILFSIFDGTISKDIQLIEQGQELVTTIGLAQFSEAGKCIKTVNTDDGEEEQESKIQILKYLSVIKEYKVVRYSILVAMWTYLSLLFLGLIIATFFGYHITTHTISELGNSQATPYPFIFDVACIIAGIITIPYNLFLHNASLSKVDTKIIHFISRCGLIWGMLGGFSYLLLGVFSSERGGPNGALHGLCALFSFLGFVFSILFFSIQFIFHPQKIAKIFGICGVIVPSIVLILYLIKIAPLLEWILLFSILFHVIPLNHWSVS